MSSDLATRVPTESKKFACDGQQFVVSVDPETGRWGHNQRALSIATAFGNQDSAAFDAVNTLCGLLDDGAVSVDQGAKAAQLIVRGMDGVKVNVDKVFPEYALMWMTMMGEGKLANLEHGVRPRFYSECNPRWFFEVLSRYSKMLSYEMDAIPDQAAWLRAAMRAVSRIAMHESRAWVDQVASNEQLYPDFVVAMFALNIDRGWREDPDLWATYTKWTVGDREECFWAMFKHAHYNSTLFKLLEVVNDGAAVPANLPSDPNNPLRVLFREFPKNGPNAISDSREFMRIARNFLLPHSAN